MRSNTSSRRTIIRNKIISSQAQGSAVHSGTQAVTHPRRKAKKSGPKPATIAVYTGAFAIIIAVVALGYQPPQKTPGGVANVAEAGATQAQSSSSSAVNDVVAVSLAADMAQTAHLSVASNVANLSTSLAAKSELAQSDDSVISKPQLVQPIAERRSVETYVAKAGDTVEGVAGLYGISKDTVKWANGLTADTIDAGKELKILPVDGVVYTVKDGDTIDSIAAKYKVDKERVVSYNDLELRDIAKDQQLILPAGDMPETERPGYVAPRATSTYSTSSGSAGTVGSVSSNFMKGSVGNRYAAGYCTWYVYERRAAQGRPIGSFWGNANTWAAAAGSQGFLVNRTPAVGAILQTSAGGGGYGHVAIVDSIDAAGNVTVSEMNYAGWNVISSRTLSAGQAAGFNYIH